MTRRVVHPKDAGMLPIARFACALRGYRDDIRADDSAPASVAAGDIRAGGLHRNRPTMRGTHDQPLRSRRRRSVAKAKKIARRLAFLLLPGLAFLVATPALSQAPGAIIERSEKYTPHVPAVTEAARRFAIPERWIWAVMRAESGGDPRAVSPKGAMGLMQIMPATWAELSARHGLGADPYDPRDNILAGAAYLREMRERYGAPGLLAAYHAGPGRYDEYRLSGRSLPAETLAYVATLAPLIGSEPLPGGNLTAADPRAWTRSALFVTQGARMPAADPASAKGQPNDAPSAASLSPLLRDASAITPRSTGLFVARAGAGATP
jgi:soluble lytic murein transglycosylase-like protein